ncbi:MAG: glycosyltransferase family 2 protein [Defluviicoccus sp.]
MTEVAVLIPCYNEALTIAKVVADFRAALPSATILVYDNNSTDGTADRACAAGAVVRSETLQGKGNVVRRMFADVEADIYVLVDGDDTYEATDAPMLIERLQRQNLDMINGRRVTGVAAAYRPGHRFGNWFLTSMVSKIFGSRLADMLSGYKVFSRRFVKSFPALASGFEIETELVVHALELRMPIAEVDTEYRERPEGSASKLRTVRDGMRIMRTIIRMIKEERPLEFFFALFSITAVLSLVLGSSVVSEYLQTGLVPRLPTAVLATGMMLLAFILLACGLILDTVTVGRQELKRLHYVMAPPAGPAQKGERKSGLNSEPVRAVA